MEEQARVSHSLSHHPMSPERTAMPEFSRGGDLVVGCWGGVLCCVFYISSPCLISHISSRIWRLVTNTRGGVGGAGGGGWTPAEEPDRKVKVYWPVCTVVYIFYQLCVQ